MDTVGHHVVAELSECQNIQEFDNEETLSVLLLESAKAANATVLNSHTYKFDPHGISGLLFLAESHISVHVFPEHKYVAFDAYTCGDTTSPEKALEYFCETIGAKYHKYTYIKRGIPIGNNHYSLSDGTLSDSTSLFVDKLLNNSFFRKS